jgi:YTH domain-containing family protein
MANLNLVSYFPHNMLDKNNNDTNDLYDPKEFFINGERENIKKSRFFVIKSYSKDDVIHSIKNGIWCSTEEGNKKLDKAFNECVNDTNASVYLFFSVNSSGHFCGIAEMMTRLDYESKSELWTQDKWQGTFEVKWIYVKDVPNIKLRHILLANNENKPVTNSRDTQEVFYDDALLVLDVFRTHIKKNSILDEYDSEMVFNQFNETNRYSLERKNKFF